MFVKGNTLSDVKGYVNTRLSDHFSDSEIKQLIKSIVVKRLEISNTEYLIGDLRFSESDLLFVRDCVHRMLKNEPFQHVLGDVEFYGLELKSDARALIPRPETEELVDWVQASFAEHAHPVIGDVCAGSGCIGLALKSVLPTSTLIAMEYSKEAISLMEENIKSTNLPMEVVRMDVLDDQKWAQFKAGSFDCLVSNPPYIPNKDKQLMHPNVLEFEPHMALFVEDDDPLVFYRVIAEQARIALSDRGLLFFEIHEGLGLEVLELLRRLGFVNIQLRKDLQGKDRMVCAQNVISQHESTRGGQRD